MARQPNNKDYQAIRRSQPSGPQKQLIVDKDEFYPGALIGILWRGRNIILLGAAICGLAGYFTSLSMDRVYEATATVIVMPPRFATELKPAPLSVETYERILGSDDTVARVTEEARKRQVISPGDSAGSLTLEIYQGREPNVPYRPLIDLIVHSTSPEKSSRLANIWAEIAVSEGARLAETGRKDTLRFILEEHPKARQRVSDQQAELSRLEAEFDVRQSAAARKWDERINGFRSEWNLDSLRNQILMLNLRLSGVAALSSSPRSDEAGDGEPITVVQNGLFEELAELQTRIRHQENLVKQLKEEVQAHPQFLTLTRSVSDDALWNQLGKDGGEAAVHLQGLKLESQEINPVYQHLVQQLADAQVQYEALLPLEEHVQAQIRKTQDELKQLNALVLEKETELLALKRGMESELSSIGRDRRLEQDRLKLELESTLESFSSLSQQHEAAQLAHAEQSSDIKIAASAITPDSPIRPHVFWNTAVAVVAGVILSASILLVVEFGRLFTSLSSEPSNEASKAN